MPSDLLHTCSHCQKAVVESLSDLQGSIRLPHSRSEGRRAVKEGCPLFQIFGEGVFRRSLIPSSVHKLISSSGAPNVFAIEYHFELENSTPVYNEDVKIPLLISASADDPAASDITRRPLTITFDLDSVVTFLQHQINLCLDDHIPHGSCPSSRTTFVPRRLVFVDCDSETPKLRLVQGLRQENTKWLALSYCWGGDQPFKTTSANLAARLQAIQVHDLPQTLQDAITIARRLRIPYVWVDSVCIVQDDEYEKAFDLARMSEVYSQAFITLSASRASHASEGFLTPHLIDFPFKPFSLPYRASSGEMGSVIVQPDMPEPPNAVGRRAWTMQERVLSPRVIDFTSHNVRWRCPASRASDTGRPEASFRSSSDYVSPHEYGKMGWDWHLIVEDYSRRALTYPVDKLLALAAVASELNKSRDYRGVTYLAGLWQTSLHTDLFWQPWRKSADQMMPRNQTYRAPSWSWASVDEPVYWPMDTYKIRGAPIRTREVARLDSVEVHPLHYSVPHGTVKHANLVIRGQMWECDIFYNRSRDGTGVGMSGVTCEVRWDTKAIVGVLDGCEGFLSSSTDGFMAAWCFQLLKVESTILYASGRYTSAAGLLLIKSTSPSAGTGSSGYFSRIGTWMCEEEKVPDGKNMLVQIV